MGFTMSTKGEPDASHPDADLEALIAQAHAITERWGRKHDFWHHTGHKDPLKHYDSEPGDGEPITLLWSEGMVGQCLNWGGDESEELYQELEKIGVYLELQDTVTAHYYLIDDESDLQRRFDQWAQWKWTCRLIEADTADISGEIYAYFERHPEDFHRLPHRVFEELISSIFAARGWKTRIGPGSGDEWVDVRVWQESPLGESLTLIQAKRYAQTNPIGLEAVAALEAHSRREGASGLFITTSRYLPGTRDWASREKVLTLADKMDLQAWCREASQIAMKERAHAFALESLQPLLQSIREGAAYDRLVACSERASFCVVLKETPTAALLAHIPSVQTVGDLNDGANMTVLTGELIEGMPGGPVFRAFRKVHDGWVSYWGRNRLYASWDGRPLRIYTSD